MDPDLGLDLLLMVLWVHTVQCMDPLHILWTDVQCQCYNLTTKYLR